MLLDYRSLWTKIKSAWAKTTSVISSMLKVVSPQWVRADAAWKAWDLTKRGIALGLIAGGLIAAYQFKIDITQLGRGIQATRSDMSAMAHVSQISSIQRQIDELKSQLSEIRDTSSKAQASKITTGSIKAKSKRR